MRGAPQSPLVPVGPDFLNYLSVNTDEELTRRLAGVGFPPHLWAEVVHVPPRS